MLRIKDLWFSCERSETKKIPLSLMSFCASVNIKLTGVRINFYGCENCVGKRRIRWGFLVLHLGFLNDLEYLFQGNTLRSEKKKIKKINGVKELGWFCFSFCYTTVLTRGSTPGKWNTWPDLNLNSAHFQV